jgi:N-methylhydantoinase A
VTLRLTAIGSLPRPQQNTELPERVGVAVGARRVFIAGSWGDVPVWKREALDTETIVAGPAIIEEDYTSILLAPGWTLTRNTSHHLIGEDTRRAP